MWWNLDEVIVTENKELPLDWKALSPSGRVFVEIGFGSGEFLEYLAKTNPDVLVVGIEVSQCYASKGARLALAKGLGNIRIMQLTAEGIELNITVACINGRGTGKIVKNNNIKEGCKTNLIRLSPQVERITLITLPILERSSVPPRARRATAVAALPISFSGSSSTRGSFSGPISAAAMPQTQETTKGFVRTLLAIVFAPCTDNLPDITNSPTNMENI